MDTHFSKKALQTKGAAARLSPCHSPFGLFFKQVGAEIPLSCVGQDGHDGLALAQLLREAQGGGDVGSAGNAAHQTFELGQILCGLNGLVVGEIMWLYFPGGYVWIW